MPCLQACTWPQTSLHAPSQCLVAPHLALPSFALGCFARNAARMCRHRVISHLHTSAYSEASAVADPALATYAPAVGSCPGEAGVDVDVELSVLIGVLPARVQGLLRQQLGPSQSQLLEVVLDLGRPVLVRYSHGDEVLSSAPLSQDELHEVVAKVGEFGGDNRAGINRSLHRISCMRNRDGRIVGLTCRAGRAIAGSASMAADVALSGKSILLLGRPGVGKTTAIRDICHMLSDLARKRVVIVDTSNEIAGDGDVPHHAIGSARRMQVPVPEQQHRTMIEAVENHMPEVIVIDEIGSQAEALAAATIAQRGVQLVATAHGQTLDNVVNNPSLQGLVGGIQSVTLGDESAKKRKVQKSIRERAGPPTFDCCIEMLERHEWRIIDDVATATDRLLAGKEVASKLRTHNADGIHTHAAAIAANRDSSQDSQPDSQSSSSDTTLSGFDEWPSASDALTSDESDEEDGTLTHLQRLQMSSRDWSSSESRQYSSSSSSSSAAAESDWETFPVGQMQVYLHGIDPPVLQAALKGSHLWRQITVKHSLEACDAVLTLRGKTRTGSWLRTAAKAAGIPIFSVKTSSPDHLERGVRTILGLEPSPGGVFPAPLGQAQASLVPEDDHPEQDRTPAVTSGASSQASRPPGYQDAVDEARIAAEQIVIPRQQAIELLPRTEQLLSIQIDVVNSFQLRYELVGSDATSRLRILPY